MKACSASRKSAGLAAGVVTVGNVAAVAPAAALGVALGAVAGVDDGFVAVAADAAAAP
jgi:hypothetical protein